MKEILKRFRPASSGQWESTLRGCSCSVSKYEVARAVCLILEDTRVFLEGFSRFGDNPVLLTLFSPQCLKRLSTAAPPGWVGEFQQE